MNKKKEITLIATHTNADLDGVASMLAAQKLYPDSKIVFHHEGKGVLKRFFIQSLAHLFNIISLKELDNYKIKKLVIVDTRQRGRLGEIAKLADKKEISIDIYDHHERTDSDIKADFELYEKTGATATILTQLLLEKNIEITPEEATILSLGIYEDTNSFKFNSTTGKDLKIAGFLRDKGADTEFISNIISKEISPEQLSLLNDMVENSISYRINNLNIVISTVSRDHYIPDLGFLTHKLNKMESKDAVFVAARMESKVFVIGRSSSSELNIGKILKTFKGGGHPFAGSASIGKKTLSQTRDLLLTGIRKYLKSNFKAKNLMSSPPLKIKTEDTIGNASKILTKYNINALLAVDESEILKGIISRQVVEKAKYHNIINVPVKKFMSTDFMEVSEDAPISEIEEKIIGNRQRILPVRNNKGELAGVLTRTDLLHHIVSNFREGPFIQDSTLYSLSPATKNISNTLKDRLPDKIVNLLKHIGKTADDSNINAYVVGGFVRDVLLYLNKNEFDIDIVVEGNGIHFANKLAASLNARISPHEKFNTAVVSLEDGLKIDVATARTEFYSSPAALPEIEMSSLKLDLYRRDFTINTLAVQLNTTNYGKLIDYFFGQRDLKDKVVRIIHNLSFVEDPTRIFRAVRFEQRFNFKIGKFTEKLIKNAIDMEFFKRLSGPRVFSELKYILMEENPLPAIERIASFGLFHAIHSEFEFSDRNREIIESSQKTINWFSLNDPETQINRWMVYFSGLIHNLNSETKESICTKFKLPPKIMEIFTKENFKAQEVIGWMKKNREIERSKVYLKLSKFKTETLLYLLSITKDEKIKQNIVLFFTELKKTTIQIKGKELKTLGFKPGPIFGEILEKILLEKIDGNIKTFNDEFDFAKRYL
ncbi:MAG: CBS domain-containing protein [Desulforegulaceae bacterium]|nr:CBS domain-containing protein [Desulforegulaceae bacterium]